jgi:tripartite-type tricarboxylate transporter receptor subunit TctC
MELTAKAAADGYTLLFGTAGSHVTNVAIHDKLPFDVIRDFSPITKFVNTPFLLSVHPSVRAASVQEFVALAKASPGKITYASYGVASFSHLLAEWFSLVAGVKLVHVPYKGSAPAIAALVAGQVLSEFDSMPSSMPHVRANRLRALAIGSTKRSAVAPEIPTFAEAGFPGFAASTWFGLFAPANTPRPIVMKLHAEIVKALAAPEIRERLEAVGVEVVGNMPDQFAAQIRSDLDRYIKVAREANIRAE